MTTANRTIQFHGYAYGSEPVQLNAHINGQLVFGGAVNTIDQPMPGPDLDMTNAPVLFSVENSSLFPTDFGGSYPLTISIATGSGVALCSVSSNYIPVEQGDTPRFIGTIDGTTLTVSSYISTTNRIMPGMVLSTDTNPDVVPGTTIISGSDMIWTVDTSQTVAESEMGAVILIPTPGNDTTFGYCFQTGPTNSENTKDCFSSVFIDGVQQVPPLPTSTGVWQWQLLQGSTLSCNLNVSVGLA
jgi:hypothetical protein